MKFNYLFFNFYQVFCVYVISREFAFLSQLKLIMMIKTNNDSKQSLSFLSSIRVIVLDTLILLLAFYFIFIVLHSNVLKLNSFSKNTVP